VLQEVKNGRTLRKCRSALAQETTGISVAASRMAPAQVFSARPRASWRRSPLSPPAEIEPRIDALGVSSPRTFKHGSERNCAVARSLPYRAVLSFLRREA
jgi:hypothetical protein